MTVVGSRVRAGRSATTIAVTGASSAVGAQLVRHLAEQDDVRKVVAIDVDKRADQTDKRVTWRIADVRDPALRTRLNGVDTIVHLATDRSIETPPTQRRALNVRGTDTVLAAAVAAGVRRVVMMTSAMVYGAEPDNAVPIPEDAPLRAEPDLTLVGDWVEMERLASRISRAHPSLQIARVRPASLVGEGGADAIVPRMFEAPRLLVIKGSRPRWQFCHLDDAVCALAWAATGRVDGAVTVGSDGWLEQAEVEELSGLRPIVLPSSVAFATAERLHRVGVLPAPASELRYVAHPWVVGAQRLHAAGWQPAWTNDAALLDHLSGIVRDSRGLPRLQRKDATRAAAGAAVAVVGTVAIARARAARRRRSG